MGLAKTSAFLGTITTPVSNKKKKKDNKLALQHCHSCGKQYAGTMSRNGRKWTLDIEGVKYTCTPYSSKCYLCGVVNDFDVAEKKK